MEIQKIKHKDGETTIVFSRPNGQDQEAVVFSTYDRPKKAFVDSFAALTNDLVETCKLGPDAEKEAEATSVAISEVKGKRAIIVSGRRTVDSGTYAVSTPLRIAYEENTGQGNLLPDTIGKVVDKLIKAAKAFIEGARDQHELPLDDAEEVNG